MDKNDKDEEEVFWERNRQLKREKQCQKQVAKAKTCLAKVKTRQQVDQDANNDQDADDNQDASLPAPGASFLCFPAPDTLPLCLSTPRIPSIGFLTHGIDALSFLAPYTTLLVR